METARERIGDLVLTIDDISVVLSGRILCRFRLSHRHEPDESLAELYAELGEEGGLEVVCRTPLTPRRMEILSRFLHLYEANIVRMFREKTRGATPCMFRAPMP
ncbi:MAG TPA: hypothetical protein VHC46_05755 [Thermodesulfobacteriota bacterium]|nr:hypothetical protein [Thermodesulfobacteriota bacterium]